MQVLKRRDFTRWQAQQGLADACLCRAVEDMQRGLIDADLGSGLYKQRIAREGSGKSRGYRTLLSVKFGDRCVFLHGFAKSEKASVSAIEKRALQHAGKVFLELSSHQLNEAISLGLLIEVRCEQNH